MALQNYSHLLYVEAMTRMSLLDFPNPLSFISPTYFEASEAVPLGSPITLVEPIA